MNNPVVGGMALQNLLTVTINQLTEVRQGQIEVVEAVNNKLEQMDGRMRQFYRTLTTGMNRFNRQPHGMLQYVTPSQAPVVAPLVAVLPDPADQMDVDVGDIVDHAAGLHVTLILQLGSVSTTGSGIEMS